MRRTSAMGLSFPPFTRAVKQLLIANGAVFLLFYLFGAFDAQRTCRRLGLQPSRPGRLRCRPRRNLAVGHLLLPALRPAASAVQHACTVDVRRAAGTGLGLQPVHAVLLLLRDRGGAGDGR